MIGYTPGAVSDLAARTIADGLHQAWGQPVIVDNRPGSGGNIGAAFVRARGGRLHADDRHDATMASNVASLPARGLRSREGLRAGRLCGREHHLPCG
ncbi:MAG: tripartite tricarboxylate transporter substrate-binding protein [Alphaproteobacteria bacterium]